MSVASLRVELAGHAAVQDLGRPGYASLGISANGASDQRAARTANALVGNRDGAAFVETAGSALGLVAEVPLLVAVTGTAPHVLLDGHSHPSWETLPVPAGTYIHVPYEGSGLRSYLAVNGVLEADRSLGSVAPDPLLGVGRRLHRGDRLSVHSAYHLLPHDGHPGLYRFSARPQQPDGTGPVEIQATQGPDMDRMELGISCLDAPFEVLPQSDHVGLRLTGPPLRQNRTGEILSRGVPVGAVEVLPSGGMVILLRGRLITAGYPVIAVVSSVSLDLLGQARPGDMVRISLHDVARVTATLRANEDEHQRLAGRVRCALEARGLGRIVDDCHGRRGVRT